MAGRTWRWCDLRGVWLALGVLCPLAVMSGTTTALPASLVVDPTPRAAGAIALIGDSTTYSYLDALPAALAAQGWGPFSIEARSGRRTVTTIAGATSGIDAVRRIRATGFDPLRWVVALGTNDINLVDQMPGGAAGLIERMLGEIGPHHLVLWVNVYSRDEPTTTARFNDALVAAATTRPDLLVLDWFELAGAHPEWFYADGIHTNFDGAVARNEFVARSAHGSRCAAAPEPQPVASVNSLDQAATAVTGAIRLCLGQN